MMIAFSLAAKLVLREQGYALSELKIHAKVVPCGLVSTSILALWRAAML